MAITLEPDDEYDGYLGHLEYNQDIAAALGILLADFTSIEFLLIRTMAALVGGNEQAFEYSWQTLGPLHSVAARLKIISACIEACALPDERKESFRKAVPMFNRMNSLRNDYVHAGYSTYAKTGAVVRETWITSSRGKSSAGPLTLDMLKTDIKHVRETRRQIIRECFSKWGEA